MRYRFTANRYMHPVGITNDLGQVMCLGPDWLEFDENLLHLVPDRIAIVKRVKGGG
jgi:hypothetical protein